MSDDDTAAELKKCLDYAAAVRKALPVDPEADRLVDAALAKYYAKQRLTYTPRKLKPRVP